MTKIYFDIIVPVYNIQNYLESCLHSLYDQTYKNFRVIIVDDGSKDNSAEIAKKFVTKDNRFEYYYKKNGGLSDARNYGILKSKNEYLLFVDGDDYLEPHSLEYINEKLNNSKVDILEFNAQKVENEFKEKFNKYYIDVGVIKSKIYTMFFLEKQD